MTEALNDESFVAIDSEPEDAVEEFWLTDAAALAKRHGITDSEWYEISKHSPEEIRNFLAALTTPSSRNAASSSA